MSLEVSQEMDRFKRLLADQADLIEERSREWAEADNAYKRRRAEELLRLRGQKLTVDVREAMVHKEISDLYDDRNIAAVLLDSAKEKNRNLREQAELVRSQNANARELARS